MIMSRLIVSGTVRNFCVGARIRLLGNARLSKFDLEIGTSRIVKRRATCHAGDIADKTE
jgi:hypothetical protein